MNVFHLPCTKKILIWVVYWVKAVWKVREHIYRGLQALAQPQARSLTWSSHWILDIVLCRLGQAYRPPHLQARFVAQPMMGPYAYGICAKPYCIEQCSSCMAKENNMIVKKWCQVSKWNLTYVTQGCLHIAKMVGECMSVAKSQVAF